jgi:hypothetical protein
MSAYSKAYIPWRLAIFLSGLFLFFGSPAHAYIDPGTGGVVFSALSYLLAAGAVALGFFLRPFRNLLRRIRNLFVQSNEKKSPLQ